MSKMGEFYIKKLNSDRDQLYERSDCCVQEIEWGESPGGPTSPPEPFAICSLCGRKCSVLNMTKEELGDE